MSSTGPGDAQGDRAKRYDRQLRIWGAHGQQRLEACKVLLLNSGPTGSETLKNLVLGGIASFTIVDGAKVTPQDVGNNFMLHVQHVGQSRAKCVTDLLYELNDGVCGSYVEETPEALLDTNPAFVSSFGLVIATQMAEQALVKLDNACRQHGVKLLIARSYGLVGYVRASLPEHRIVETKPDTQVDDLRILSPWPDLLQWATSFDVPALDDITHRHLPYVVLLIQAAQAWVHQRGSPPATSKERAEFKALLAAQKRVVDGIPLDEDNFDEAVKHAFHAWSLPSSGSGGAAVALPSEVVALLADDAAQVTPKSDDFWVLVAALRAFVGWDEQQQGSAGAVTSTSGGGGSGGGLRSGGGGRCLRPLPLEGSIPDMTSTTDLYLQLQRLYRDKAEADVAALAGHVRTILASLGRDKESISTEAIRHFAKNARNLQVLRYKSLEEETSGDAGVNSIALQAALSSEATAADASFYVLLRAADRFAATHGRPPGAYDGQLDEDVAQLKATAAQVLSECGVSGVAVNDDYVVEICRCGGCELHVIAALVGGIAAQEAIKLATEQFVPVTGTLVYNGITCTTSTLDL